MLVFCLTAPGPGLRAARKDEDVVRDVLPLGGIFVYYIFHVIAAGHGARSGRGDQTIESSTVSADA